MLFKNVYDSKYFRIKNLKSRGVTKKEKFLCNNVLISYRSILKLLSFICENIFSIIHNNILTREDL